MKSKISILFLLIVLFVVGCSNGEPAKEFTFENESENWEVSISGTYDRGKSDIYEEASAIFTYIGEAKIRSIDILTYTSRTKFMRGTESDELPADSSIETSFGNFGFWEAHEEGKEIIVDFEWREGDQNTKKVEKVVLEETNH